MTDYDEHMSYRHDHEDWKPNVHTHTAACDSITCYERYFELSFPPEPGTEPIMSREEWERA